ncbi:MAG: hypothetical protein RL326_2243, partial [Pseudomonadota bacterium]
LAGADVTKIARLFLVISRELARRVSRRLFAKKHTSTKDRLI